MNNNNIPEIIEFYNKKFKILIRKEEIAKRVEHIASLINKDYKDKNPLFLIVLKGGIFFASDLLRLINLDCEIDAARARSYGKSMKSSGNVQIEMKVNIEGRDVIIIEDIIDTGLTMQKMLSKLNDMNPNSLEIAVFLSKPDQRKVEIDIKYLGFDIPSDFVIGYGLDFAEKGRHLPCVYSLIQK